MTKRILICLALCLVAGGALRAQNSTIAVKTGAKFSYDMNADMNITQSVQGQDMTMKSKTNGVIDLAAKKVDKNQIDWTYGINKAHIKFEGSMLPKAIDSTIKGMVATFSTDPSGRITTMPKMDGGASPMMMMGSQKNSMAQLFSPTLTHSAKPGDSWQESGSDTMDLPGGMGLSMMVHRTTKFTYDGVADTLGQKVDRIRAEVTSMSIEGSGSMQGMEMTIDGDGTSMATNYYGTDNSLLVASRNDMEMNVRIAISGAQQMVVPMSFKINSTTARKGK